MAGKTPRVYKHVTPEQFVEAWESSKDLAEVERKTGIPAPIAAARASLYRTRGVNLKQFTAGRKATVNVDELNKLIAAMGGRPVEKKATPQQQIKEKTTEEAKAQEEDKRARNATLLTKLLGGVKK